MGNTMAFLRSAWVPKATWSVDDIPDLTGKVVLVTGGNTGIGKETAKALLAHNAKVYLACRTRSKAEEVIAELRTLYPTNEAIFLELDLGNLNSIEKAVKEFLAFEPQLHVLINNAGVMGPPIDLTTSDGYDLQFGTNVLGHFYLTKLLLPAIFAASTPTQKARVVTVSSNGAFLTTQIRYELLKDGPERRKVGTMGMYFQSKLGNALVARELARLHGDRIVSICLHPGGITTDLGRHIPWLVNWVLNNTVLYSVSYGAITQLYAATAPEVEEMNGKFLFPWARMGEAPAEAKTAEGPTKMWKWCEEQVAARG